MILSGIFRFKLVIFFPLLIANPFICSSKPGPPVIGPVKKTDGNQGRDSILSVRLLYILSASFQVNDQKKLNSDLKPNFELPFKLPGFLKPVVREEGNFSYSFRPVGGDLNLNYRFGNPSSFRFDLGFDTRVYKQPRLPGEGIFRKAETEKNHEIYLRYQFRNLALISRWEFSSLKNKFEEAARWESDKVSLIISYLF